MVAVASDSGQEGDYDKIVELIGSFKVPMGCRSFLQGWTDENGNDVSEGRMNLGVVTLNLPRIALESGGDTNRFWSILAERVTTVGDALLLRIERCKEATPQNAPSKSCCWRVRTKSGCSARSTLWSTAGRTSPSAISTCSFGAAATIGSSASGSLWPAAR